MSTGRYNGCVMFFLLILLAFFPAPAQQPRAKKSASAPKSTATAPATAAYPVESLTVEGNREYTREQVLAVAGLKVGQTVTKADLEAARDRLGNSGAFETLEFKYGAAPGGKGYAIVFKVTEAGPFYPILFEEIGLADDAAMTALGKSDPLFGKRIPASQATVDRYVKVLEAELTASGKPEKLSGRVATDDSGQLVILFRPARPLPRVARVRFTGVEAVRLPDLENAVNSVAVGTAYKEPRFRAMLDSSARPLFDAKGRIAVAFEKLEVEKEKDVEGLVVTVTVKEGPAYKYGSVVARGAPEVPDLIKEAKLKSGEPFNGDELRQAVGRLEKRMRREGFMGVKIAVERQPNASAQTADLVFQVTPGARYTFRKLTIVGLDLHSEPEIRKMWAPKPGQPFNADYPGYFLDRIREDQIFDNLGKTESKIDTDEKAHTVDVTLVFRGGPPPEKKDPMAPAGPR